MEFRADSGVHTYEDFEKFAADHRCEWIDGVIYDLSGTSINHSRIVKRLFRLLDGFLTGKPCELFQETVEVRFAQDARIKASVQPDLMVVCEPEKIQSDAIHGAPTLIIEVLSPSTSSRDCILKKELYERGGVKEYWIVSPQEHSITLCVYVEGRYETRFVESGACESVCFPGLRTELAELFRDLL